MATLVSPGTAVDVIDESFFIPGRQTTVPLIFVATADEKTQPDGSTPAMGTYEDNVIRTVTSRSQALKLYGTPSFLTNSAGQPQHGDARNEYGLDALFKYLEIGERAYVIRANVNLNDTYSNVKALWTSKVADAGDDLNALVTAFIQEYNDANGYVPASGSYKQTVTKSELVTLVNSAMEPVFDSYSFSSSDFQNDFLQDHTQSYPGYQEILYDTSGGYITGTDNTGLNNDSTVYGFELALTDSVGSGTHIIQVTGSNVQTFAELATELQSAINTASGAGATNAVGVSAGKIRITSDLDGATSSVEITSDGTSGSTALFANTNLFESFATPVSGEGIGSLDVYTDDFTSITGTYDGVEALINNWSAGGTVAAEFTPSEAEGLLLSASSDFANTLEFRNGTSLGANDAARRATIVQQIQAAINNPNTLIRSDRFGYNLTVAPGYWEATDELLSLAQDQEGEVFVIADTPLNRPPTGPNSILEWQQDNKVTNNLVAYYYPHGITSNTDGVNIMTTAASAALRVYAFSDQQGELWYAPAGPSRGGASFFNSIGYVSGTLGTATTFVENDIDKGTQDTLFAVDINYFANIVNRGVILMSQNTTQSSATAMDRVNVVRLTAYIRRELRTRLFDFLFEPNDTQTRQNVKAATDSFLSELVGRRGLFDFASQVDDNNNGPDVVDRSELVVDVAIKPIKAVEFIYVDLRLVRSDAILR